MIPIRWKVGKKPLPEPIWPSFITPYGVTREHCVNAFFMVQYLVECHIFFSLTCITLFSKLLHSRPSTPTTVWVKCFRDCVKRLIECQLRRHQQSVCHCDLADNIAWHLSPVGNLYYVYCWVFIHKPIRLVVDIPIIIPTLNASVLLQIKA